MIFASQADAASPVPIDQLVDLSGRASVVVTLKSRDRFANEFRYDVAVKNESADAFSADSLIVVLEEVVDLAGKDAITRMQVVAPDGETPDGKPFFRIPPTRGGDLPPYTSSEPVTVRLKNPAYTVVFTPSFRVLGMPHTQDKQGNIVRDLGRLLIRKGVITENEWREVIRAPSSAAAPPPAAPPAVPQPAPPASGVGE